jgi:hypothetical protein
VGDASQVFVLPLPVRTCTSTVTPSLHTCTPQHPHSHVLHPVPTPTPTYSTHSHSHSYVHDPTLPSPAPLHSTGVGDCVSEYPVAISDGPQLFVLPSTAQPGDVVRYSGGASVLTINQQVVVLSSLVVERSLLLECVFGIPPN